MGCELNLTKVGIEELVDYLEAFGGFGTESDEGLDAMRKSPIVGEETVDDMVAEARQYETSSPFGNTYELIEAKARDHIIRCGSCNSVYRTIIQNSAIAFARSQSRDGTRAFDEAYRSAIKNSDIFGVLKE